MYFLCLCTHVFCFSSLFTPWNTIIKVIAQAYQASVAVALRMGGSEHTASRRQFVYVTHFSAGDHADVIQVEHWRCQELWTHCSPGSLPQSAIYSQKNSGNVESWLEKNVRNPRQRDSPHFVINLCFFSLRRHEGNEFHSCVSAFHVNIFFPTKTWLQQVAGSR